MEEENSGEEEVGGVVYQPSHHQYAAAGPPVTEVSCCAEHKCDTGRGYKGGLQRRVIEGGATEGGLQGRGHMEREGTVGSGIAVPTCAQITNLSLPPTKVEGSERQEDQDGNCADPP